MKMENLERVRELQRQYSSRRKDMELLRRLADSPTPHEKLRFKAVFRHERNGLEPHTVDLFQGSDLAGPFSDMLLSHAVACARARVAETVGQLMELGVEVTDADEAAAIKAAEDTLFKYTR